MIEFFVGFVCGASLTAGCLALAAIAFGRQAPPGGRVEPPGSEAQSAVQPRRRGDMWSRG